jgi:hypothetical protein
MDCASSTSLVAATLTPTRTELPAAIALVAAAAGETDQPFPIPDNGSAAKRFEPSAPLRIESRVDLLQPQKTPNHQPCAHQKE